MLTPNAEHPIVRTGTRVVYDNPYMRVIEDNIQRLDGTTGIYSYIEKPDFALVIAAENDGFHMVEQYRYPVRDRSLEFVQGTFPNGADGDPFQLAHDELQQETGFTAATMRHLGRLNCAKGMSSQGFNVFLATDLTPGIPDLEVEEQDLTHRWLPRTQVEDLIRSGGITDDSTLAAYTLYLLMGSGR
ncbi:ADP-ribose pyrophosphatase [Nonomuraea sp. NPDC050394]|uniref:ADP-ribose pyrophosphatase n=1 Tax=Nonomuraea sp. NPDC050394 TaxID=3364363 RepID=UPI0037B703CA